MGRTIDTLLFLDFICSAGVVFIDTISHKGLTTEFYLSIGGERKVGILTSDEYLSEDTACFYLDRLNLAYLIENIFPQHQFKLAQTFKQKGDGIVESLN